MAYKSQKRLFGYPHGVVSLDPGKLGELCQNLPVLKKIICLLHQNDLKNKKSMRKRFLVKMAA